MSFFNPRATGRPVVVKDEGVSITDDLESIDFEGGGVTGAAVGNDVTETIPTGAGLTFSDNETPSGTINGSNTAFTLANTPNPTASLKASLNGFLQSASGVDYSLSGTTITFNTAPRTGSILRVSYRY